MQNPNRPHDPLFESGDGFRPRPTGGAAGVTIAFGIFLVFAGPALALVSLLAGAAAEDVSSASETTFTAMHVVGLLAALLGCALLLVGVVWWLRGLVRARRGARPAA